MARPKSTKPNKQRTTLCFDEQARLNLKYLSSVSGKSISSLISDWADKEASKAAKKRDEVKPSKDQLTVSDFVGGKNGNKNKTDG